MIADCRRCCHRQLPHLFFDHIDSDFPYGLASWDDFTSYCLEAGMVSAVQGGAPETASQAQVGNNAPAAKKERDTDMDKVRCAGAGLVGYCLVACPRWVRV